MKATDFIDALQKHVQEIANNIDKEIEYEHDKKEVAIQINRMIQDWKENQHEH